MADNPSAQSPSQETQKMKKRCRIDSKCSLDKLDEMDNSDDESELVCFCGYPAELRMSRTSKNPYLEFYNCPNNAFLSQQCKFFRWSLELPPDRKRRVNETNLYREECINFQQKCDELSSKVQWLNSLLSAKDAEIQASKNKIKHINESEEMPPIDESYQVNDDEDDGEVVLGTV